MKKLIQLKNKENENLDPINSNYEKRLQRLEGTILYDNSSGSNEDITLNDDSSNYRFIEIYYKNAEGEFDISKVAEPNGKLVSLKSLHYYDNVVYTYMKTILINNNTISKNFTYSGGGYYGDAMGSQHDDVIFITKIIGYK